MIEDKLANGLSATNDKPTVYEKRRRRQAGRLSRPAAGPCRARRHAKVNLWLNVVGRRADGYHLLDSLVAFVDLADTLEARPSDRLSLDARRAAGRRRWRANPTIWC